MTGIVNSTGARSGVIGTTVGTPSGVAGSIVQTTTVTSGTTSTTMGTTDGTWYTCVITKAITPLYNNSDIIINATFGTAIVNASSSGGYAFRWQRAISGGATTYPTSLYMHNSGGTHSNFLRAQTGSFHNYVTLVGMDSPATTSTVTYTLSGAPHAITNFDVGGPYGGRWHIYIMEVKR